MLLGLLVLLEPPELLDVPDEEILVPMLFPPVCFKTFLLLFEEDVVDFADVEVTEAVLLAVVTT